MVDVEATGASQDVCLLPFKLPKTIQIIGASQSGKSQLVAKLLLEYRHMFQPQPKLIIYCFEVWQEVLYGKLERELGDMIQFRKDIPTNEELTKISEDVRGEVILVLDDKMSNIDDGPSGKSISQIATVLTHHNHISLILLLQNAFKQSASMRTISLNTQIFCLFKNDRSALQIKRLACEIMPGNTDYFLDSYRRATENNYGYLIVDLSADLERKFKLRSKILPEDQATIIYLPKK